MARSPRFSTLLSTLFLSTVVFGSPALFGQAPFDIDVSVSGYPTRWGVNGVGTFLGDGTVPLSPGTYGFSLTGVAQPYFEFTVNNAGLVTTAAPDRASGGDQSLTLITHPIDVDVAGYPSRWTATGDPVTSGIFVGSETLFLAAAVYELGLLNVQDPLLGYSVGINGTVTSLDPDRAVGTGSTLTLITHAVDVSVHGYPSRWWGTGDTTGISLFLGDETLFLPAAAYTFGLFQVDQDYVEYEVGITGFVTTGDPLRATGGAGLLELQTHPVDIEVMGYPGRWLATGDPVGSDLFRFDQSISLPPATFWLGLFNVDDTHVAYSVSPAGTVASLDPGLASGVGSSLTLHTVSVDLDVDGAPYPWSFGDTPLYTGDASLCLAPSIYEFDMEGATFEYNVDFSSVVPSSYTLDVGGQLYDIALALGAGPCPPPQFVRGDCNDGGEFDIADPIYLLGVLFGSQGAPPCDDACDANDDGQLQISDAIWMLDLLFSEGTEPILPFPECGQDPSADSLDCGASASCG